MKKMLILTSAVTAVCFVVNCVIAQAYLPRFRTFGLKENLSTSGVTSIVQDKQGKIWIGTHDGLNCHFGTYFKSFYQKSKGESGLRQSAISDLLCDNAGNIWIATYGGGLNIINPVSMEFLPLPKVLSNLSWKQGFCLKEDREKRIWMGFNEGLAVFDPKNGRLDTISMWPDNKTKLQVHKLEFDLQGHCFVATPFEGLQVYEYRNKPHLVAQLPFQAFGSPRIGIGFFNALVPFNDEIQACTQTGLYSIAYTNGKIKYYKPDIEPELAYYALLNDKKGNAWVASEKGFHVYAASGKLIHTDLPHKGRLNESNISTMFEDNMGGIWIGGSKGVHYHHPQMSRFYSYAFDQNISEKRLEITWCVFTEDDQHFLVGTKVGMFTFDAKTFQLNSIETKGYKTSPIAYKIIKTTNNQLLAGTNQGIFKIVKHPKGWMAEKFSMDLDAFVSDILPLPNEHLLVATYDDKGLFLLTKTGQIIQSFKHDWQKTSLINNSINCLVPANSGKVWIGTDKGASLFDFETQKFDNSVWLGKTDPDFSPLIYSIADLGDEVWFGSFGSGIMIFNKQANTYSYLKKAQGMPNESVYQLQTDGKRVFASTNKGLFTIDPKSKSIHVSTEDDGLQSDEYNHFASFKNLNTGAIYFGGLFGFDEVTKTIPAKNTRQPTLALSFAQVIGEKAPLPLDGKPWKLNYKQQDIELEFAAIDYVMPIKNKYKYQLDGNEKSRIDLGTENKLTLIGLKPGSYNLQIFGSNNDGVWSASPISVPIKISPPWWETWWFKTLLIVLACTILLLIFRLYIKARLRKQVLDLERQQAVRKERNRISTEMHDDLGSGLTSIKMLSELLKLKSGNKPEKELERIAVRADELVDNLNTIVWALNDRNDKLSATVAYLRSYAARAFDENNIELHLNISVQEKVSQIDINGKVRRNLFLILKEGIHNVIKHAHATQVWLSIEAAESGFKLILKDNGVGTNTNSTRTGGNGLINMQERANQIEATCSFSTQNGFEIQLFLPKYN